ncbi:MAG TPA: tyrosine-type recombinase/integrase [Virgibacillus sp.]|nr:tyrosine-type recombinase/integrase [Virgibacillus sp.]HLR67896.1 tyrosine-type recombinase/integrase [Virgibacillus sp.]
MSRTRYPGVYKNKKNGRFFYNIELGVDKITGKRIQKKGSRTNNGEPFLTARAAHKEATRIRGEYHDIHQYKNYNMTYGQFMKDIYLPIYKGNVEESTWQSRKSVFKIITNRFSDKKLREITVEDCELFRVFLLNESGYSKSFSSMVYSTFRRSLEKGVNLQYIDANPSMRTKAIPKGKAVVPYWTKEEFEKVISAMCIENFHEHMSFVMLWLYYTTGMRVSEGLALTWSDVDLEKKSLRIHGTLEWVSGEYRVKPYTKTKSSQRTISLDNDTIYILTKWKERQLKHGVTQFIMSCSEKPLVRSTVNGLVNRYSKLAKVKRIQAKGLRHSHASYLINQHNIDVLVISRRLGHSSPEITLKHYAHLWSRNDEVVADAITGDIEINLANKSLIEFYGNQHVEK